MTLLNLMTKLNEDLGREYLHFHFYMHAAVTVRGFHRAELSEFFLEEAAGEKKHIEEFKRLIMGVSTRHGFRTDGNKIPLPSSGNLTLNMNSKIEAACSSGRPLEILSFALEMEDEVVANYVQRIEEAQVVQETPDYKVDGKYIELFLEDQILDSRADADNIREMLLGF